jgi:hypothetical protein
MLAVESEIQMTPEKHKGNGDQDNATETNKDRSGGHFGGGLPLLM